jgi:hypothetical protein
MEFLKCWELSGAYPGFEDAFILRTEAWMLHHVYSNSTSVHDQKIVLYQGACVPRDIMFNITKHELLQYLVTFQRL